MGTEICLFWFGTEGWNVKYYRGCNISLEYIYNIYILSLHKGYVLQHNLFINTWPKEAVAVFFLLNAAAPSPSNIWKRQSSVHLSNTISNNTLMKKNSIKWEIFWGSAPKKKMCFGLIFKPIYEKIFELPKNWSAWAPCGLNADFGFFFLIMYYWGGFLCVWYQHAQCEPIMYKRVVCPK